ncbi:HIT domain-containing protein [Phycisphaerales bacterium AB-hyl4]|uniref:HIT domain-containing protein n=1 Tax=Natronomicrosphaera hydrolytica TaxID=3242702 RepID=A0ABV4U2E1_9BACT
MRNENLWAPWRIDYIRGLSDAKDADPAADADCFLCDAAADGHDTAALADRLILLRDERGLLMLNRYPYTNGHLLIAPLDHVPELSDMTADQRTGLMELTELATRLLKTVLNPQGVNLGMNLGRCAGAGVPGHAHMHVVPRWNGDVNFMNAVAGVRVIPQDLASAYDDLKTALPSLT